MSGIRKLKRKKLDIGKREKPRRKLSSVDVLLIIGLTLTLIGIIVGIFSYLYYIAGRPEQISNTRVGTFYLPEEAPKDPGRKYSAVFGFVIAGIGILLSSVCLIIYKPSLSKIFRKKSGRKVQDKGDWPKAPPFHFPWD